MTAPIFRAPVLFVPTLDFSGGNGTRHVSHAYGYWKKEIYPDNNIAWVEFTFSLGLDALGTAAGNALLAVPGLPAEGGGSIVPVGGRVLALRWSAMQPATPKGDCCIICGTNQLETTIYASGTPQYLTAAMMSNNSGFRVSGCYPTADLT